MPPGAVALVAPRAGKQPLCFKNIGITAMGNARVSEESCSGAPGMR